MWQNITIWYKQRVYVCSSHYSFNFSCKFTVFPNVKFENYKTQQQEKNNPKMYYMQLVEW